MIANCAYNKNASEYQSQYLAAREEGSMEIGIRLLWHAQAQFAGYLVAEHERLGERRGIAIANSPIDFSRSGLDALLAGEVEFAVASPSHLLESGRAAELVLVLAIQQDSALAYPARRARGIDKLADLAGRRVAVWPGGEDLELRWMLQKGGVAPEAIVRVATNDTVAPFLAGDVDCAQMTVYHELRHVIGALGEDDITLFRAADVDAALLKDGLLTTRRMIIEQSDVVQAVVDTVLEGWAIAFAEPARAIDACMRANPVLQQDDQLEQLDAIRALALRGAGVAYGLGYPRSRAHGARRARAGRSGPSPVPDDLIRGATAPAFWLDAQRRGIVRRAEGGRGCPACLRCTGSPPTRRHRANMTGGTYDVIVIGAGIVGCAVAYELSKSGCRVALLDKGDVGGAVTGGSLACIGTHMISREELPLLIRSRDRWRQLRDELDADFEYSAGGQMRFVRAEADIEVAKGWIDLERAHGLESELLDPAAVRERVPALRGPILAATWSPRDATVNPFLSCRALVEAAARNGCKVMPGTAVTSIRVNAGRVTGVVAGSLELSGAWVVDAAGPWAAHVAAMAGCEVPIVPRKAQCLATVAVEPMIPCVIGACETAGGVEAGYTQIQQAAHGQILFNTVLGGGVRAHARPEDDLAVDRRFVRDSVAMLLFLFPGLEDVSLLRSWCAYEGVTPDDRFLIGPVPECVGFLLAAGDGGTGFNRAPVIAEMIAAVVRGAPSPLPMEPYAPDRFRVQRAAA
jgi:glycine/D-amino acid oxidase-like deaminating enzyme/ABC-type nitrate/sulfonate/bicarbonate transport system substrate-binding protein